RKMREEEPFLVFGRNSVAAVGNFDLDRIAVAFGPRRHSKQPNRRALDRLRRVVDQIREHPPYELRIRLYGRERGGQLRGERYSLESPMEKLERALHNRVQICGRELRGREARKLRKFTDQGFKRLHLALNEARAFS